MSLFNSKSIDFQQACQNNSMGKNDLFRIAAGTTVYL
jgi:hypothetical protein